MAEELFEALSSAWRDAREASPPAFLEVRISFQLVSAYFLIDLSILRARLFGIFLD
jgi:hypothetical protein